MTSEAEHGYRVREVGSSATCSNIRRRSVPRDNAGRIAARQAHENDRRNAAHFVNIYAGTL